MTEEHKPEGETELYMALWRQLDGVELEEDQIKAVVDRFAKSVETELSDDEPDPELH